MENTENNERKTINLDKDTYDRLVEKAKVNRRSYVDQIRWFLDEDDARKLYGSIAERAASLS